MFDMKEITVYSSRQLEPASSLLFFHSPSLLFDEKLRGMHRYSGLELTENTTGRVGDGGDTVILENNEVYKLSYPER